MVLQLGLIYWSDRHHLFLEVVSPLQTSLLPEFLTWLYNCFFWLLLGTGYLLNQQIYHYSPKWGISCSFKMRVELQGMSIQTAGKARGRKEGMVDTSGMCKWEQMKWSLLCLWYWLVNLCLPLMGGKGINFIPALGYQTPMSPTWISFSTPASHFLCVFFWLWSPFRHGKQLCWMPNCVFTH